MSGISEYSLDSFISNFQTKFGRMPELDELPRVNSELYLKTTLNIKEYSSINSVSTERILNYTNSSTIEEANIKLNNLYKDLEISLTPFESFTSIEYEHRPSVYSSILDPIEIESDYNLEKSRLVLTKLLERMQKLYGINIIPINSDRLDEIGVFNSSLVKGLIKNGNIYINTDNATIDTPIHELTHIFFGAIRYTNPELFFSLSSTVELLPRYEEYSKNFPNRTRGDINEEIFVLEFSKYLTKLPSMFDNLDISIMSRIFYEIYRNIDTLISGNYSVKSIPNNVFGSTILELSKLVLSNIVNNKQQGSLDEATLHRTLANLKEDLMSKNKLEERCDG